MVEVQVLTLGIRWLSGPCGRVPVLISCLQLWWHTAVPCWWGCVQLNVCGLEGDVTWSWGTGPCVSTSCKWLSSWIHHSEYGCIDPGREVCSLSLVRLWILCVDQCCLCVQWTLGRVMKYSCGHFAMLMGHYVLFWPSRNKQEQHKRRTILNALVIKKNKNVNIITLLLNRKNKVSDRKNIANVLINFKYRSKTSQINPKCPNNFNHYMNERIEGSINLLLLRYFGLNKHC